jgi:hypothetical protein
MPMTSPFEFPVSSDLQVTCRRLHGEAQAAYASDHNAPIEFKLDSRNDSIAFGHYCPELSEFVMSLNDLALKQRTC